MDWIKFVCGTCGSTGLIVESIAGGPWAVLCSNRHQLIQTGGDIVFEIDENVLGELERLRKELADCQDEVSGLRWHLDRHHRSNP